MHTITWEPRGIIIELGEVIDIEAILYDLIKISGNSKFDTLRYKIIDYSKLIDPNLADINKIITISYTQHHFNKYLLEASITSDPKITERLNKQRAFAIKRTQWGIFETVEAAREWIGIHWNW